MARLQLPQNNLDAIRQDYRDKHASSGALFAGRKFNRQTRNKDGQLVFKEDGSPKTWRPYIQLRQLITNEDELIKESHWFSENCKNDCYATINSFLADCTARTADNVAYLTGYYIDFDYKQIHKLAKQQQGLNELVEDALSYSEQIVATLADYLPSDYGMPVISYTGGGYGFYFRLRPLEATEQNKVLYREIHEQLYQRFNILFAEILADIFDNDHAVVGDIVRVIRITGTYNGKTGAFARYIARYGNASTNEIYEYRLDEIISLYHLDDLPKEKPNERLVTLCPLPKEKREKREKKENEPKESGAPAPNVDLSSQSGYTKRGNLAYPTKWYQGWSNSKQLGKYLDLAVKSLEYLDSQGSLQRNNALFLIACLKVEIEYAKHGTYIFGRLEGYITNAVVVYMCRLNYSLSAPLDADELTALTNHALTNQYHFRRRDAIQKYLNLTNEEFESLGWLDKQRKEQEKQERNNTLTDLDKDVVKLYLSGLSDAKIAKQLGIPKRQSIRIRQRLGVMDRSVKWEDIDFESNKRHVKHNETKADAPEPTPIFSYMPWYKPTYKNLYKWDYCDNSQYQKNAVAERARMMAKYNSGSYAVDYVARIMYNLEEGPRIEAEVAAHNARIEEERLERERLAAEEATRREQKIKEEMGELYELFTLQ